MACVYLTMSGFSAGKNQRQRWSNSWGLQTSGSIFTHISDNWCWLWSELGGLLEFLHIGSPWGLGVLRACGLRVVTLITISPKAFIQTNKAEAASPFMTLPWKSQSITFTIFCWSQESYKGLQGWGIRFHFLMGWGEFRGSIGSTFCELETVYGTYLIYLILFFQQPLQGR